MYCRVPHVQMVRLLPRGVIETPIAMGPWFALQTLTVIRISTIPNSCDTSLYKTSKVESLAARTFNLRVRADYLFVMLVPFVESAVSRYATTAR